MPRAAQGLGSVHRRASDNLWTAVAHLGRDPLTGKRVRRSFYGRTQREAVQKRKQWLRDLEEGLVTIHTPRRTPYTVASWMDYWLAHVIEPDREPTTHDTYSNTIANHIKPSLGSILLTALETEHVEAWLKAMRDREPPVGLRTRQQALLRLRTALGEALKRRQQTGLRYNPALTVRMPSGPRKSIPPPSVDATRALLAAAQGEPLEAFVIVTLGLGLRRGEAVGLRWEDVDFDARTIRIRRHVSRVTGKGLIVREGTKMHPESVSTIAMPTLVVDALRAHRARQSQQRLPTGYVFVGPTGGVLDPRTASRFFDQVRTRAGQKHKTLHQLRHDFAGLLLTQGVPLWAVSQILRHKSLAITADYYAHLSPQLQMDAADRMDDVLRSLTTSG